MSFYEAKYALSFVTTAIVATVYAIRVKSLYLGGYFDGPDAGSLTGRAILVLIGGIVVAGILSQIILAIGMAAIGSVRDMDEDERDKLIELRALHMAFSVFGAGFLGSFVALAWGRPVFEVFHYIVYSMVLFGLTADVIRLWLYRRGF